MNCCPGMIKLGKRHVPGIQLVSSKKRSECQTFSPQMHIKRELMMSKGAHMSVTEHIGHVLFRDINSIKPKYSSRLGHKYSLAAARSCSTFGEKAPSNTMTCLETC